MPDSEPAFTLTCAQCAAPLPDGSPPGHCPVCLCRVALFDDCGAESGDSGGGAVAEPGRAWSVLGGYELYDEIGRGGMGVVYRARQRALGRDVAVKVLRGGALARPEERRRFQAEAEHAAALRHPGIVAVHDVGEEQGVWWLAMELVAGRNLEELLRIQPMTAAEAARCMVQIARAVEHAHRHGVLHRDLKPSNVVMDPEGNPRITDFGIARRTGADATALTRSGQMIGSPGYAAPEQSLRGESDARTDVYGMGGILYHILTGRAPFHGPTAESVFLQMREQDPLPPRQLSPSVPRDLETICLKCLAKDPGRRYADAAAFCEDLDRFLAGEPILARPRSWLEHSWRWLRRHWAVSAAAATAAASLVAASLISRREAAVAREAAVRARDSELEARRLVYFRDLARAQADLARKSGRGADLLNAHIPPQGGDVDLRGWEWRYLKFVAAGMEAIEGSHYDNWPDMAPDGLHFAHGTNSGTILIRETTTHRIVRTLEAGSRRITRVQWLADGRRLASISYDGDVRVHDTGDGALLAEMPAIYPAIADIVWSPDGKWFAHTDWDGEVIIRDAKGAIVRRPPRLPGIVNLSWHPSLPLLAVHGAAFPFVRLYPVDAKEPGRDLPMERRVTAFAWHPDGKRCAVAKDDATLTIMTADGDGPPAWQRALPADGVKFLQFTPDGTRLVLGRGNGAISVLHADGSDAGLSAFGNPDIHANPDFARISAGNGSGVSLSVLGELRVWELGRNPREAEALHTDGAVKNLTWSPDGRFLHVVTLVAPAGPSDRWRWRHPVRDTVTRQWLEPDAETRPGMAAWSPDCKKLARVTALFGQRFVVAEAWPSGDLVQSFRVEAPVLDLTWSPDGSRIAASVSGGREKGRTIVCSLSAKSMLKIPAFGALNEAPAVREALAWSPDGRSLVIADALMHYDAATGSPAGGWPAYDNILPGRMALMTTAWHPSTGEVAAGRETGLLEVRSAADGGLQRERYLHHTALRAIAWHPGERRLATSSRDGLVKVVDADTLEEILVFPDQQPDVRALAWSPDGHVLASGASDGSILLRQDGSGPDRH